MKKKLLSLILISVLSLGISNLNASEIVDVNMNDIETNTFIIGNRIFEMNNFLVSVYDVVAAADEYRDLNNSKAPIYVLQENAQGKYLIEYTGPATMVNGKLTVPTKIIKNLNSYSDGKVFIKGTIKATQINGVELSNDLDDIDDIISNFEAKLSSGASLLNTNTTDGFSSVSYSNKIATFTISDPTRDLADSSEDVLALIDENMEGLYQATYTINGSNKTVNLENATDSDYFFWAYEVLSDMSSDGGLTLGSVANKTKTVNIKFKGNVTTKTVTYTLKFVYDATADLNALIASKDIEIANAVTHINSILGNFASHAISSFSYNASTKTLTATVVDEEAFLVEYAELGDELLNHLENTKQVSYTIGGSNKVLSTKGLTSKQIIATSHEFLEDMAINDDLTLGSVLNQTKTLTVTYELYGQTKNQNYKLTFIS